MPFTSKGADIVMRRNDATGRLDFDWDSTGNPPYGDDNVHRVLSLLIERRASPGAPGWWADGARGSLLYTLRNVFKSTPSEAESHARDAVQKAVDEGWIFDVSASAQLRPADRANVRVAWRNPGGDVATARHTLGA